MAVKDLIVLNETDSKLEAQQGTDTARIKGTSDTLLDVTNESDVSSLRVDTSGSRVVLGGPVTMSGDFSGSLPSASFGRLEASVFSGSGRDITGVDPTGTVSSSLQLSDVISGSWQNELSSSDLVFVDGGISGSSVSTGSFGRFAAATYWSGDGSEISLIPYGGIISSSRQISDDVSGSLLNRLSGSTSHIGAVYVGGGISSSLSPTGGDIAAFGLSERGTGTNETIEFITISTEGDSLDFGDITGTDRNGGSGASNGARDRGIFAGGYASLSPNYINTMDYITISAPGNSIDFGDLTVSRWSAVGLSNSINDRAVFIGGQNPPYLNVMDYVTVSTAGDATDFGDTIEKFLSEGAVSNGVNDRGVFTTTAFNYEYITISSTGNASEFGNQSTNVFRKEGMSNDTNERGIFITGGNNVIDYITISTLGDAFDFGDRRTTSTSIGTGNTSTSNATNNRAVFFDDNYMFSKVNLTSLGNATNFGSSLVQKMGSMVSNAATNVHTSSFHAMTGSFQGDGRFLTGITVPTGLISSSVQLSDGISGSFLNEFHSGSLMGLGGGISSSAGVSSSFAHISASRFVGDGSGITYTLPIGIFSGSGQLDVTDNSRNDLSASAGSVKSALGSSDLIGWWRMGDGATLGLSGSIITDKVFSNDSTAGRQASGSGEGVWSIPDASGHGYHAVSSGSGAMTSSAALVSPHFNGSGSVSHVNQHAMTFDGLKDEVIITLPDHLSALSESRAIAYWFKTGSSWTHIVDSEGTFYADGVLTGSFGTDLPIYFTRNQIRIGHAVKPHRWWRVSARETTVNHAPRSSEAAWVDNWGNDRAGRTVNWPNVTASDGFGSTSHQSQYGTHPHDTRTNTSDKGQIISGHVTTDFGFPGIIAEQWAGQISYGGVRGRRIDAEWSDTVPEYHDTASNWVVVNNFEWLGPVQWQNFHWTSSLYSTASTVPTRFNGAVDEVMVFNRPLSAAEVATLYNSGTGSAPSTIGYQPDPGTELFVSGGLKTGFSYGNAMSASGGGDRAVFGGGQTVSGLGYDTDTMDYVTISTPSDAIDFGNLTNGDRRYGAGLSNGLRDRGIFAGGNINGGVAKDYIDYITILTTGNSTDFGNLTATRYGVSGTDNGPNDRGVVMGGDSAGRDDIIDYVTITSAGDAATFGDLTQNLFYLGATSNGVDERAVNAGGGDNGTTNYTDIIDFFTISTLGNSADFGNLTISHQGPGAASNDQNQRAVFGGGQNSDNRSTGGYLNTLSYITMNSPSNAADYGDLSNREFTLASGTSNALGERGLFNGVNANLGKITNTITISTTGDAIEFGSLTVARMGVGSLSNSKTAGTVDSSFSRITADRFSGTGTGITNINPSGLITSSAQLREDISGSIGTFVSTYAPHSMQFWNPPYSASAPAPSTDSLAMANKYSMNFDGSNDYIDAGSASLSLISASAYTVAGWYKQTTIDEERIMWGAGISTSAISSLYTWSDGKMYFDVRNGATTYGSFDYSTVVTAGKWFHAAAVYDGGQSSGGDRLRLYIDGDEIEGLGVLSNMPTNTSTHSMDLRIGDTNGIGGANWEGNIGDFAVWSVALSSSAVSEIYNGGLLTDLSSDKGSYDQSVSMSMWLRMGDSASYDGTNWSIYDSSGNGVSGSTSGSSVNMTIHDRVIDTPPTMVNTLEAPYPVALSGSKAATIAFWAKVGSTGPKAEYLIGDAARQGWEIRKGGTNNFQFAVLTGSSAGATASFVTDHAIPDNNSEGTSSGFAHYALTYEGGSGQIIGYVQGSGSSYGKLYETASLDFQTGSFVDTAGQGTLRFGRLTDEIGSGWLGSIAEVAIWSSSLSASAIADLAEGPFDVASKTTTNYTATSSLVSYWTVTSGSYNEDT